VTLRRLTTVPVPAGARAGFDHADVYRSTQGSRVYVANTGADRIDVFDCGSHRYLRELPDHPGVAGILIDSQRDLLLATDRAAARLSIRRASDESLLAHVAVGQRPNGVALDTHRLHAYTFDLGDPPGESCTMTVVDLARHSVIAQRVLPGRPRWAAYDEAARVVYANISEPACVAVVDAESADITRTIAVPAAGPHGLALIDGLLFCAADSAELVVLETNGTVRARLPLSGAPDVLMYDRDLGRAYVAIGAPGHVQSFDTKALRPLETVETEEGAHTIGWDAERKELWVFAPRASAALVFADAR
jgi:DNA-binding beta-propeller fold protein YncE